MDELIGAGLDFNREEAAKRGAGLEMLDYAPGHTMHPIRPLMIELAFADRGGKNLGFERRQNYRFEF